MDGADGGKGGAVKVARELCVLDKGVRVDELLEVVYGGKVVVFAIGLSWARCSRGVCLEINLSGAEYLKKQTGDGKAKAVWKLCKETLEESALAYARGARQDKWTEKVGRHGWRSCHTRAMWV